MNATSVLESALAPADHVRRRLLRSLGPVAGRLAADRETRVAVVGTSVMLTALVGTLVAPLWMLALGPIALGVPHLLADVRYLWVRPGLHKRVAAWLLIAAPLLLGFVLGRFTTGLLAAAGAVLIARASLSRKAIGLVAVVALMAVSVAIGRKADLAFAHLHNFIAVALWWGWRPRAKSVHWIPLALFVGASVALALGLGASWAAHSPTITGGGSVRYHAQALAPGYTPEIATRVVLLFCFAQSVHYGVWLRMVPEEDRPRATPRTFAASARALIMELGAVPVLACVAMCFGLALWAVLDLAGARIGYLRFAAFHGQLELAAIALLLVQGRRATLMPNAPAKSPASEPLGSA